VIYREQPGQCDSRNEGLQASQGTHILFLDDDDEISADLVARHLANLEEFRADVSCGVAHEAGAGALPKAFTYTRASDVFPTNNSMIKREVLERTGLFDLAYNRGQRADGDLGMRIHLSGAVSVLRPEIRVFHHHAPVGGLRAHRARVITYAGSRRSMFRRQLPSSTEIYLGLRYFSGAQVKEMLWQRAFSTLIMRGSAARRAVRLIVTGLLFPHTCWTIGQEYRKALAMLKKYPAIPTIAERSHDAKARAAR